MSEEKLQTGVKELDSILSGGVYKGVNILVKGGTGTGKTTLSLQYLIQGARLGERCMYLSFEESSQQIIRYGSKFFPDLKSHIDNGVIQIMDFSRRVREKEDVRLVDGQEVVIPPKDRMDSIDYIEDKILDIRGQGIQRVVIDGLQTFATTFYDLSGKHDIEELRRTLSHILSMMKKEGITTYLLSEEAESQADRYFFVNFTVDGVLVLKTNEALDMRTLRIMKMRGIKHTLKPISIQLQEDAGVVVAEHQKHGL